MRVLQEDIKLSEYVRDFPCLYNKTMHEHHQRDAIRNCWDEVAKKAGVESDKSIFFTLYIVGKIYIEKELLIKF